MDTPAERNTIPIVTQVLAKGDQMMSQAGLVDAPGGGLLYPFTLWRGEEVVERFGSGIKALNSAHQFLNRSVGLSYTELDILTDMRPVCFLGSSLKSLRDFPEDARHDAGYQLEKVQRGEQPDDFKPMPSLGQGVEEIRVADDSGSYRVIYVARRAEAVYVLHAFRKKTQTTAWQDIETAKKRLAQLLRGEK